MCITAMLTMDMHTSFLCMAYVVTTVITSAYFLKQRMPYVLFKLCQLYLHQQQSLMVKPFAYMCCRLVWAATEKIQCIQRLLQHRLHSLPPVFLVISNSNMFTVLWVTGGYAYSCCAVTYTELCDEAFGQHRFFREPMKSAHSRSLLPSRGGSKKLASQVAHC